MKLKNSLLIFFDKCDWFVYNKLSIQFSEDKAKLILSISKFKRKNKVKLNIK